ncbi:coagulation factor XIII B chain-like isoform X2 [Ruditapes philippinarum]|nr:coagulation factor XIII B chain-like isoform X2 [Ruditapes philippinarum]
MPCDSCASGKFCEQFSKTCTYSECPSQSIDTVVVLGNVNAVGSKIRYRCAAGYDFTGGERYSVCKPDGQWNATASCTPQRADCGPPPAIPNGVALLSNLTGTLSGDTATIMCNDWYQSKVTTISCSNLGVWQTATCADCYLTTSRAYSGLTAKTITGKTCLRWDASIISLQSFHGPSPLS